PKAPQTQTMQTVPEEMEGVPAEAGTVAEVKTGHSAADNAADKLRPASTRSSSLATGLISAWPAAGMVARAVAAFIDITAVLVAVAALIGAAPLLPTQYSTPIFRCVL